MRTLNERLVIDYRINRASELYFSVLESELCTLRNTANCESQMFSTLRFNDLHAK